MDAFEGRITRLVIELSSSGIQSAFKCQTLSAGTHEYRQMLESLDVL